MPAPEDIDATMSGADPDETVVDEPGGPRRAQATAADSLQSRINPSAGPTRLGRYVLLREIGRGAIGVVYAAYHEGLDRKLAIKVLNKQRAGRADLEARLRREARALAKLSHPNVVQVYDVGEFAGRVFVAMEFVEGEPLSDWMRREHSVDEIVRMFVEAGRGLAAAHEAGVVHRDFKPDNVLVGSDGRPRVLDFGLARAVEHESEDGVVGSRTNARESGPIGTSLDQLLQSGMLGRSVGGPLSQAEEVDPDATIDIFDPPPPELAEPEQSQDAIVTQTNIAGAELRALPTTELGERERGHPRNEATLAPGCDPASPGWHGSAARSEAEGGGGDARDLDALALFETQASGDDFGHEPELAETVFSEAGHGSLDSEEVLTRTGAMMGTPAYMSPEQFLGHRVDQASDQFSFCVALYEALYGHRPFTGKNPMDLALATQEGAIVGAPPNSPVPAWLRAAVVRGLNPSPDARFESMHDLIAELTRDREQPRRRWKLALALGSVGVVALAVGLLAPERKPLCPSVDASVAELWTKERAAELRAGFEHSQLPYADAAWTSVENQLRSWSRAWAEQRVQACEATRVRQEFSAEVLDLRQACLDRQLRSYEALLEQLRAGDATVIERAVEATAALPDTERCGEVDALLSGVEPPPASVTNEVEQLRTSLAEIDALANTGRWQQGLELARLTVEQARGTNYGPIIAEALLSQGRLLASASQGEQAVERLQDALDEAERSEHDALIPRVAIELVSLSIYTRPDPIRGRVWARRAIASLDRIARVAEDGHLRARGIWSLGNLERLDGEYEQSEAHLREALALLDEHAPGHPERAVMLNDLGNTLEARGELERARETYEQALRESLESFGQGHPRVGHAHYNLARLEFGANHPDVAREQLEQARRVYVEALGPRHRDVGSVELLLAGIETAQGNFEAAEAHATLANEIYEAELAPDNVDRAEPRLQLGHVAFARARYDEAIAHYRACLAIQQVALPPGHISMVPAHTNLGLVYLVRGEPDSAVVEFERAVEILEAGAGVDPHTLRLNRAYLGDAMLARGAPGDARRALRRFELAFEGCETPPALCADLALRAARANAAASDDEAAARWAGIAVPLYEQAGEHETQLAEAAQLMATGR